MTDRETEEYRTKLIQRYEEMNISVFTEEELIDFLLLTVYSKKDYIKIKEALVENFGMNLSKIIDTGSDNLEKIGGIDKQTANFISMIPTVARVYTSNNKIFKSKLTLRNIGYYSMSLMLHRKEELLYAISIDKDGRPIQEDMVSKGGVTSVNVDIKYLSKLVIKSGAHSVILIHNHPNGYAEASEEDVVVTKLIVEHLKKMDIYVIDHIIVNDENYYSMQKNYPEIFFR